MTIDAILKRQAPGSTGSIEIENDSFVESILRLTKQPRVTETETEGHSDDSDHSSDESGLSEISEDELDMPAETRASLALASPDNRAAALKLALEGWLEINTGEGTESQNLKHQRLVNDVNRVMKNLEVPAQRFSADGLATVALKRLSTGCPQPQFAQEPSVNREELARLKEQLQTASDEREALRSQLRDARAEAGGANVERDMLREEVRDLRRQRDQFLADAQEREGLLAQLRGARSDVVGASTERNMLRELLRGASAERDMLRQQLAVSVSAQLSASASAQAPSPADVAGIGKPTAGVQRTQDMLEAEKLRCVALKEELARTRTTAQDALAAKVLLSQEFMKASEALRELLCKAVQSPAVAGGPAGRLRDIAEAGQAAAAAPRLAAAPAESAAQRERRPPYRTP